MQRAIVTGLFILGLIVGSAYIRTLRERWNALRWLTVSLASYLMEYVVVSAVLLLPDVFSVARTLAVQAALNVLMLAVRWRLCLKRGKSIFGNMDWDLCEYRAPVAIVVAALLFTGTHFGFFGMGQDQGVYQTKAIDFMNGRTSCIYHFEEFDVLESDALREETLSRTREKLGGLYQRDDERFAPVLAQVPSFLNVYTDMCRDETDAVYHGIPTYPALLALFGILGGGYAHPPSVCSGISSGI